MGEQKKELREGFQRWVSDDIAMDHIRIVYSKIDEAEGALQDLRDSIKETIAMGQGPPTSI